VSETSETTQDKRIDQKPEREEWYWYCDCGRVNQRGQITCCCGNGSSNAIY
jgi:hypothetical protein